MRGLENIDETSAPGLASHECAEQTLYVAIVYAVNDVRFITAAMSRGALAVRLAGYVRQHAGNQLWPDAAGRVYSLLAERRFDAAVEHYFATVGGRWDEERLVIEAVEQWQSPPGTTPSGQAQHTDNAVSEVE